MTTEPKTALRTGLGARLISPDVGATAFQELPIIDLTNIESTNLEERKALAGQVQKACIESGFFYIKNHGVADSVLKEAFAQSKVFFAQPLEKKMLVDMNKSSSFKGYLGIGGEQVDPDSRGDLHEAFDIGSDSQSFSAEKKTSGNQYPPEEDLPGFKKAIEDTWDSIMALGQRLFPIFALALDLPEDYFKPYLTNPGSVMRILHYPSQPQEGPIDPKEIGIGAHTDYECFTLLVQDEVEALQVLNANNEWIKAPPVEGTIVVNLGDQLERWTNGVFKSTVHRAINRTGKERQSLPFFFGVDYDATIEALPTCVTADRPAKYEPVKAGEWVESRLKETYLKAEVSASA
ncbi:Clavaminate synthase-like protein [Meredithblackwellia eburnea MCA 4105]